MFLASRRSLHKSQSDTSGIIQIITKKKCIDKLLYNFFVKNKKKERSLLQTASFYMKAGLLHEFITVTEHNNNMFCDQSPCIAHS
jgi:hypothetical protein